MSERSIKTENMPKDKRLLPKEGEEQARLFNWTQMVSGRYPELQKSLDYAIAGVRSKMSSIGIKLTDKDLSRDEIGFMIGQLNALQADLFELEEEREKTLRGAADVEVKDRDS